MIPEDKGHAFHACMKKHDFEPRPNMRKEADRRFSNDFRIVGVQSTEQSVVLQENMALRPAKS